MVEALFAGQPGKMAAASYLVGPDNMPGSEVTAVNIDHFPLAPQLFNCLSDLLSRRLVVNVMHLVKVNVVWMKSAQAFLTLADRGPLVANYATELSK